MFKNLSKRVLNCISLSLLYMKRRFLNKCVWFGPAQLWCVVTVKANTINRPHPDICPKVFINMFAWLDALNTLTSQGEIIRLKNIRVYIFLHI